MHKAATTVKKSVTFYFDFISPFAYLAFEALPRAVQGTGYAVQYKPILFAALLKKHGQLGPAEIKGKREWTYRHVMWLARQSGLVLDIPAAHPFNPLELLRLAVACDPASSGSPSRDVCEAIFQHVWWGGDAADDPVRISALMAKLRCSPSDASSVRVKDQLRENTTAAAELGLFGVPTCVADGRLFWGLDALPMLRQHLLQDCWFTDERWRAVENIPMGVQRAS